MKLNEIRVRDPFLLTDGKVRYLTGTTAADALGRAPRLCVYRSDDGVDYARCGTLIPGGVLDGYRDFWAPEIHRWHGRYYLIITVSRDDLGRGCIILHSDRPDGGFQPLTGNYITPAGWGCLDATLFVTGRVPYLCFSNEWITPITGDGDGALYMMRLTDDLTAPAGAPHKIVSGRYSPHTVAIEGDFGGEHRRGYVAEAPWLYETADGIVLLWSTFTDTGYAVIRSVSREGVFGEYRFDRILFRDNGGHAMCFTDPDGRDCVILHCPNTPPDERPLILPLDAFGEVNR